MPSNAKAFSKCKLNKSMNRIELKSPQSGVGLLDVKPRFKSQVRDQNENISSVTSFQQISGRNSESN